MQICRLIVIFNYYPYLFLTAIRQSGTQSCTQCPQFFIDEH